MFAIRHYLTAILQDRKGYYRTPIIFYQIVIFNNKKWQWLIYLMAVATLYS